jgi:2,4-diaminopentanoate dehydrogenase
MAPARAMTATAMRVVNAVPFVVDAPAGLLSSLDLPLTVPHHAFA